MALCCSLLSGNGIHLARPALQAPSTTWESTKRDGNCVGNAMFVSDHLPLFIGWTDLTCAAGTCNTMCNTVKWWNIE